MTDRDVVSLEVIFADRANNNLTSIDADSYIKWSSSVTSPLVCMFAHLLLHAQCRIEGPVGVILVGNGCAKECKDAIAEGLRHISLVAMHCLHHNLQRGVYDPPSIF